MFNGDNTFSGKMPWNLKIEVIKRGTNNSG